MAKKYGHVNFLTNLKSAWFDIIRSSLLMYVEFWSGWCTQLAYLSDKSKCTNMGSWTKNIWKMLSMITRISYMMITTIIAWKLWSMHDEKRSHYDVFYTLWNISGRRPWKNEAKGVILSEKFHRIWNTSYYMYSMTLYDHW